MRFSEFSLGGDPEEYKGKQRDVERSVRTYETANPYLEKVQPIPDSSKDAALIASGEADLLKVKEAMELSVSNSFNVGFEGTLTNVLKRNASKDYDEDFSVSQDTLRDVGKDIPLSEDDKRVLQRTVSQEDYEDTLDRIKQKNDWAQRIALQTGTTKYANYAALLAGGMLDPVAIPFGTFGAARQVFKGAGIFSSVGRGALEGGVGAGMVSPILQYEDKGMVDVGEVMLNSAGGMLLGGTIGFAGGLLSNKGVHQGDKLSNEYMQVVNERNNNAKPEDYISEPATVYYKGTQAVVDFSPLDPKQLKGKYGEHYDTKASAFMESVNSWDETVSPQTKAVQDRLNKYMGNKYRAVTSWSDSSGVVLAQSPTKAVRYVGAMWGGDQLSLGKQYAGNAAVQKELIKDQMLFDYLPELRKTFESTLTPAEKLQFLAGGGKTAQDNFSKAVMLERASHRKYRAGHGGSSEGYVSTADPRVKHAADVMDSMFERTKKMHMEHGTEHSSTLKDSDHVGYTPQKPNYSYIRKLDTEKRKAFYDMLGDAYKKDVRAALDAFRANKEEWLKLQYAKAEKNMESKETTALLTDEDAVFEKAVKGYHARLSSTMEAKRSHWWDNALQSQSDKMENSSTMIMDITREMLNERLVGRELTDKDIYGFIKSLEAKWIDRSRREFDYTDFRDLSDGTRLYFGEMFEHDIFSTMNNNINSTAGDVALAKLGWKTEDDIQKTFKALRLAGASDKELKSAKFIVDVIKNRQSSIDDSAPFSALTTMLYNTMMGKLAWAIAAELPSAVGNLGIKSMASALGSTLAKKVTSGALFRRNNTLTATGRDLEAFLKGVMGYDNELWIPQGTTSRGDSFQAGNTMVRLAQGGSRLTGALSASNAVSKIMGETLTRASVDKLHTFFKTGKGISVPRLEGAGLHQDSIKRIKAMYDKHATKDGQFGLSKWEDAVAKEELITSAYQFTKQSSVNKIAPQDQWTAERQSVLGVIWGKFRGVGIRAAERVAIRNLAHADANSIAMFTTGTALTAFLAYARLHIDAATKSDPEAYIEENGDFLSIANQMMRISSIFGAGSELTNLLQLLTGSGYNGGSDTPLTGYVSNVTGLVSEAGKVARGEKTVGDFAAKTIKVIPAGNTYAGLALANALSSDD